MGMNVTDSDTYAHQLFLSNFLREPALRSAILTLQLPAGSHGLDAGCGIGLHTVLLAKAVGPTGHVTGLDLSTPFLTLAKEQATKSELSAQISFQEGDLSNLPFDDDTFDWAWSVDTVYPGLLDPLAVVKELARVVKPGGIVAILFWSAQKLLPGYPLLEATLDAAFAETAPYTRGIRPTLHFLRALGWLRNAGLEELTAHTFAADIHSPLSDPVRSALTMTFRMFWGAVRAKVTPEDWAEFERLCQPESKDFILDQPDYYAFLTYSLFSGRTAR
jgi:ubiquinone/menaquinone biosynthesis C-methylase UbiE